MSIHISLPHKLVLASYAFTALISGSLTGSAWAAEDEFAGEKVVHWLQEPRHRTVLKNGDIYVLDVQLNPGDESFAHTHDSALLVTPISNGEGPTYGRVNSNINYASQPFTHKISNPGPGLLRIIAMTNLTPRKDPLTADRPTGMPGEPTIENAWFRSYRIALAPGEESATLSLQNPSVVVQVTDGKLHVSRADGITAELDEMAKWTWRDANSAYQIRNVGSVPVELVVNEARR